MQNNRLSIDNVIALLDEEYLFSYYFPLKITKGKNKYISPFRNDSKIGSCHFNWYKGRFLFFDKAYNKVHDVFDYLSFIYNISIYESLYKVNRDFDLNLLVDYSRINSKIIYESDIHKIDTKYKALLNEPRDKHSRIKYRIKTTRFSSKDLSYWDKYCIDKRLLYKNNVRSIKQVDINNNSYRWNTVFKRSDDTLYFLYMIPSIDGEEPSMKLYSPYSEKYKWSSSIVEDRLCHGYSSLDRKYDDIIIASSLKDSMVLQSLGYESCCPLSESSYMNKSIIGELKLKYKRVFILFDNDNAGITNSQKFSNIYDVYNLNSNMNYLTDTKDIAELINKTNHDFVRNIITNATSKHVFS